MNEDLKAYLDGELSPERVAAIESALKHDQELQAELAQLRALKEAIRSGVVAAPTRGYEQTLVALRGGGRSPRWYARPATAWSAVGLAASTVFAVWALTAQRGALESTSTTAEMRPAQHSPKIQGAGEAALLDDVESLPGPTAPNTNRKVELEVADLESAVAAVDKLAFDVRADHMAKNKVGDRVRITVVVPTAAATKFAQDVASLGATRPPAPAEQKRVARNGLLPESSETTFEIVLVDQSL